MNSIYKIVFNKATQTFTAVSELAKGATKTQSQSAKQAGTFLPKFAKITLAISMVLGFSTSTMAAVIAGNKVVIGGDGLSQATGLYSIAAGYKSKAEGSSSIALGERVKTTGDSSFSVGVNNVSSGYGASSFGGFNKAIGTYSFVTGDHSVAKGSSSLAAGEQVQAIGTNSVALGVQNISKGYASFTTGQKKRLSLKLCNCTLVKDNQLSDHQTQS